MVKAGATTPPSILEAMTDIYPVADHPLDHRRRQ